MTEESLSLIAAREHIAKLAEKDGEIIFAREVRAGCWDHRNDIQAALVRELETQVKTVLEREAESQKRHDAKLDELEAKAQREWDAVDKIAQDNGRIANELERELAEAKLIIEALCAEFRNADLPYGSKAYMDAQQWLCGGNVALARDPKRNLTS